MQTDRPPPVLRSVSWCNGYGGTAFSLPCIQFGILTVCPSTSVKGSAIVQLIEGHGHRVVEQSTTSNNLSIAEHLVLQWINSRFIDVIFIEPADEDMYADTFPTKLVTHLVGYSRRLSGLEQILNNSAQSDFSLVVGIRDGVLLIALPTCLDTLTDRMVSLLPFIQRAVKQIKDWSWLVHTTDPSPIPVKVRSMSVTPFISPFVRPLVVPDAQQFIPSKISIEEAQSKLFEVANHMQIGLNMEAVDYRNAVGRVLGHSLRSQLRVPSTDVSTTDGFAIRYADFTQLLEILPTRSDKRLTVSKGKCARVAINDPLPAGADTVIPLNDCRIAYERPTFFYRKSALKLMLQIITPPSKSGQFIQSAGSELGVNDLLPRGLRLGVKEIKLLACSGALNPWSQPFSTYVDGDVDTHSTLDTSNSELLKKGGYLPCVKLIRLGIMSISMHHETPNAEMDFNRIALPTLISKHVQINTIDFGTVLDIEQDLEDALRNAFKQCDVLITTGGLCTSEEDNVPIIDVLSERFGAIVHFCGLFIQPGWESKCASVPYHNELGPHSSVLVFCLPKYEIASQVISYMLILPLLRKLQLRPEEDCNFPVIHVRLLDAISLTNQPSYRLSRLMWDHSSDEVSSAGDAHMAASVLSAVCIEVDEKMGSEADLILCLPQAQADLSELPKGSVVRALVLKE